MGGRQGMDADKEISTPRILEAVDFPFTIQVKESNFQGLVGSVKTDVG